MSRKSTYYKGPWHRDIKWIRVCRDCGVEYRPKRYSFQASSQRCYVCRKKKAREYWATMSPEEKKKKYTYWFNWTENNLDKRRTIALASYHRNKNNPANKARKHRPTHGQRQTLIFFRKELRDRLDGLLRQSAPVWSGLQHRPAIFLPVLRLFQRCTRLNFRLLS